MLVARTQQQLRGAEAARGQEDSVGTHARRARASVLTMRSNSTRYPPSTGSMPPHHVERPDHAAVLFREGQIREVESVLRANLASDVAVAEMDARALLLPLRVDERLRMPGVEGSSRP